MKKLLLVSVPVALAFLEVSDASACGGCFVPPASDTQVVGHRMVLSLSQGQTTLYDQIEYAGEPSQFAWVLPILGQADVGLSSDGLFATLDQFTAHAVYPPPCPPPPPSCVQFGSGGGGGAGGSGNVTILTQETVGPYDTVQLQAADPMALQTWLASNGYDLPADVAPLIDAYVAEGFAFLAMKLAPGQGVAAMRPVRVTTQGAGVALPLRMVAAGTGAYVPITLVVMAEGRYEPQNFPSFEIADADLTVDASYQSNWSSLFAAGLAQHGDDAFLVESAGQMWPANLAGPLDYLVSVGQSGYGAPDGTGAAEEMQADLDVLFAGMDPASVWATRLYANLPHASLASDLYLQASPTQVARGPIYFAGSWAGTPACPDYSWCSGSGGSGGDGGGSGGAPTMQIGGSGVSCALGGGDRSLGAACLVVGLALAVRRRRRQS